MVSINTNLSSLIAQRSFGNSTNKLNFAIERMTTGYKINHASDNAANYSIASDMDSKIGSYDVACENIKMGMDLLLVAQDTVSLMQERGSRIHALITQARNGTYGTTSQTAMLQEVQAHIAEINRLYANTEYNGIKLFNEIKLPEWAETVKRTAGIEEGEVVETTTNLTPTHNGFIAEVVEETPDVIVTDPAQLANAISANTKIGIANAETLAELAHIVNGLNTLSGKTIILTEDIDLSDYQTGEGWNSIHGFAGTFNGNGHKVTGLYINKPNIWQVGLFSYVTGEIKNLGVEGNVKGQGGSIIAAEANNITNCYAKGSISAENWAGGLCQTSDGNIDSCYAQVSITIAVYEDVTFVGGLVGTSLMNNLSITNSFSAGSINCEGNMHWDDHIGGLIGEGVDEITNCYSSVNILINAEGSSDVSVGGLIGYFNSDAIISNCYATGNVNATNCDHVGGLIGCVYRGHISISNCYATGDVTGGRIGNMYVGVGGLFGYSEGGNVSISNCYATGNVIGGGNANSFCGVGGLAGYTKNANISNSYATGDVTGLGDCWYTGGLVGYTEQPVSHCYATGDVNGYVTGGLAGFANTITDSFATGNVYGSSGAGGLAVYTESSVSNCYATGNVTGRTTGGLLAITKASVTNCFATGNVLGENCAGGLFGRIDKSNSNEMNIDNVYASGQVTGTGNAIGSFAGVVRFQTSEEYLSNLNITNATAKSQGVDSIGALYNGSTPVEGYDMSRWTDNISTFASFDITLQVGINADKDSQISFETGLNFNLNITDLTSDDAYDMITNFLDTLSAKTVEFGATQNRLESALGSVQVSKDNLVSSRSTIKDADIAKESSKYIQQQILQQAAATLLATANQSPSIALQLI